MEGQVSLPMDLGNLHKDEDLTTIQKRKSRHKFSLLHPIPIKVLNSTEDSNAMKKGKRNGFTMYDNLACKHPMGTQIGWAFVRFDSDFSSRLSSIV